MLKEIIFLLQTYNYSRKNIAQKVNTMAWYRRKGFKLICERKAKIMEETDEAKKIEKIHKDGQIVVSFCF